MKEYLLLLRGGDDRMSVLSETEREEHMQKWGVFMNMLAQNGNLSGGLPLQNSGMIMTSEGTEEGVVVSDKGEAIGGYLLIKANDYKHAVELSKSCPIFEHHGNIEIRELAPMEM